MRGWIFIAIVLGIIFVMGAVVFIPVLFGEGAVLTKISGLAFSGNDQSSPDEFRGEGNSGGNSGDSGSSGSGGEGSQGGDGCHYSQYSYSIQNFEYSDECVRQGQGFCLDKTVICSLEVQNLDLEFGGTFGIRVYAVIEGDSVENYLAQAYEEEFIDAKSSRNFAFEFLIQSYGEDGDANKNLECIYRTELIPKREYC